MGKENVSNNFYKISEYCLNHVAKNIFAISKHEPFLVVRPVSNNQLVDVVRYAYSNDVPIFVRGGGTGYCGGHVPTSSGIVLETTGLNRIIEVDADGRYVTCEAGISVQELNRHLQSNYNLWWTHDPGSREWATVGGTLSTLGGGAFQTKYGIASDNVVSMKIVTSEGKLVTVGGSKVRHNGAAYNLLDTITSGEGTLGLIAEATLKIFKIPQKRIVTIALFEKFEDAANTAYEIFDSGLYPESVMFDDILRFTLEGLAPFVDLNSPQVKRLELDSMEAASTFSYAGKAEVSESSTKQNNEIVAAHGGKIIDDRQIVDAYWKSKTELPSWSSDLGNLKIHSFVPAVPLNRVSDVNHIYSRLAEQLNLKMTGARYYLILPHLEVVVSPTIMFDDNDATSIKNYEEFCRRFSHEAIKLDGTPSSALGVGMRLDIVEGLDPAQMEMMKRIKLALDPTNLLNRGKKMRL